MQIKTITVVGSNGVMGRNVSALFASFGNCKVFMISKTLQKSNLAIDSCIKIARAESIKNNLIPCDYSKLEECVSNSDLVYEAVIEDINTKKDIIKKIGYFSKDKTIIVSGTSGLSIKEISTVLPKKKRKNFYGMHFFNPVFNMSLVELIPCDGVSVNRPLIDYLQKLLLRKVIVCKDTPGFVANRLAFHLLNNVLQYAEQYKSKGGIDYIDNLLGTFTGRSMTPGSTLDFIGLDVYKSIVDNIYYNANDFDKSKFKMPNYVNTLIKAGKLGNKTTGGLYSVIINQNGEKNKMFFDIATKKYINTRKYCFDFIIKINSLLENGDYKAAFKCLAKDESKEGKICKTILKDYIDYSILIVKELKYDLSIADDAMAEGFNWCPPLALSNVLFGTSYKTKYDYRKFFKAII